MERPRYRATKMGFIPGRIDYNTNPPSRIGQVRVQQGQEFETDEDVEPGFWWQPLNPSAEARMQKRIDDKMAADPNYRIPKWCTVAAADPREIRHVTPPPNSGMRAPSADVLVVHSLPDNSPYPGAPPEQFASPTTERPRRREAAT